MAVIPLPKHEPRTLQERVAIEVRSLMGRHGVRQADLAEVLGVAQSAISARLNNQREFTLEDLDRLAAFFGVEVVELLGGTRMSPRPTPPDGGWRGISGEGRRLSSMDTSRYPDCFAA